MNAQILDNKRGLAFTEEPFFDEVFIRTNKIKKIKGEFTHKKAGDVMRKTEFKSVYEFNSMGQLISSYETRNEENIKDTIQNYYEYYPNNQLAVHRKKDSEGYGSIHYERDSLNRVISEETRRDLFNDKGQIERSLVINHETMKYDTFPLQQKKTVFNSYNLPYLEEVCHFNEDGYLLDREENLKMTSNKIKYFYEYNEKGYISAIRSNANINGVFAEEWLFRYDDYGNLIEKHVYKNGKFVTDIQIIYNSETKLLSSVLTQDIETNFIVILRFMGYEFFE